MEPHPIPQNVTTFQFHLVGDMTLKQFLYLAAGVGAAYGIFVLFAKDYPFFAWPTILIFAGVGAVFAFLPIQSRPLDYWLAAFLKAIYSPTKRQWRKNNTSFRENPLFQSRFLTYLAGLQPVPQPPTPPLTQPPPPTAAPPPSKLPSPEELQKTVELAKQAQSLQMRIIQTERALSQIKTSAQDQVAPPLGYPEQVNKTLTDLQNLVSQASQVRTQIESVQEAQPAAPKPKVKVIIPPKPKQTQVALTTFPNVINGIIKDASGNYLEGAVVVIYDKEGLPVRALKSNKLGQFTGSTPLPGGTYTIEMEKEGFSFDVLQIELSGEVIPPLNVTAKGS